MDEMPPPPPNFGGPAGGGFGAPPGFGHPPGFGGRPGSLVWNGQVSIAISPSTNASYHFYTKYRVLWIIDDRTPGHACFTSFFFYLYFLQCFFFVILEMGLYF